jgi:hypothetical protein
VGVRERTSRFSDVSPLTDSGSSDDECAKPDPYVVKNSDRSIASIVDDLASKQKEFESSGNAKGHAMTKALIAYMDCT